MPIYAYRCRQCGQQFDKFRSIHDDDAHVVCPGCGTTAPERLITTFSSKSSGSSSPGGFRPT